MNKIEFVATNLRLLLLLILILFLQTTILADIYMYLADIYMYILGKNNFFNISENEETEWIVMKCVFSTVFFDALLTGTHEDHRILHYMSNNATLLLMQCNAMQYTNCNCIPYDASRLLKASRFCSLSLDHFGS